MSYLNEEADISKSAKFSFLGTPVHDLLDSLHLLNVRPEGRESFIQRRLTTKRVAADEEWYVRDAQGRRRFHGAFTGGFSAGHFNTVGSVEGWTPSQFVSSRSSKESRSDDDATVRRQAVPEDFMDEEDFSSAGIAPRSLKTSTHYSVVSDCRGDRLSSTPYASTPTVADLFRSDSASDVGTQILRIWGWKPGQGVGPRISASQREAMRQYTTGQPSDLRPSDDQEAVSHSQFAAVPLAPDDVVAKTLSLKTGTHGLGYDGQLSSSYAHRSSGRECMLGHEPSTTGTGYSSDEDICYGDDYSRQIVASKAKLTSYSTIAANKSLTSDYNFFAIDTDDSRPMLAPIGGPTTLALRHDADDLTSSDDWPDVSEITGFHESTRLLAELETAKQIADRLVVPPDFIPLHAGRERKKVERSADVLTQISMVRPKLETDRRPASSSYADLAAVLKSRFIPASTSSAENVEMNATSESDSVSAARLKMFGARTRSVNDWMPEKVLCTRFNVKMPENKNDSQLLPDKHIRPTKSGPSILDGLDFGASDDRDRKTLERLKEEKAVNHDVGQLAELSALHAVFDDSPLDTVVGDDDGDDDTSPMAAEVTDPGPKGVVKVGGLFCCVDFDRLLAPPAADWRPKTVGFSVQPATGLVKTNQSRQKSHDVVIADDIDDWTEVSAGPVPVIGRKRADSHGSDSSSHERRTRKRSKTKRNKSKKAKDKAK